MNERFIKPTDKQLIEFAIVFKEGKVNREELAEMLAYATMIIDRLYENGTILEPSKQEIIDSTP